jgi:Uma2 family endonuclease
MPDRGSRHDLIYNIPEQPARPLSTGYEEFIARFHAALDEYVVSRGLGRVWEGIEVVLDRRGGLVLRPDIVFLVDGRESIVSDRVWGPPDMVVEVTAPDVKLKTLEGRVGWFSMYGVREYWLVQPEGNKDVAILELAHGGVRKRVLFDERTPITSPLLPEFDRTLTQLL